MFVIVVVPPQRITQQYNRNYVVSKDACFVIFSIVKQYNQCNLDALEVYAPGSVAETMAPKNRQSVKKKSPPSCPTCFISITQPYISNLTEEQRVD